MSLIQIRRGIAAAWTSENPVLAGGEFGLETDTGKTKIGNGSTAWLEGAQKCRAEPSRNWPYVSSCRAKCNNRDSSGFGPGGSGV